ncbi:MAG: N-formylglutamate amidohydrolase [Sphingorhabdus sp.]
MIDLPYRILGEPEPGAILIVGDHASNHVPPGVLLDIDPALLTDHIAWDIGVAAVAAHMAGQAVFSAFLGNVSRLVTDLNRYPHEPAVIPDHSDGIQIVANRLSDAERETRLSAYYHPYHDRLAQILTEQRPVLILSLHSFTPSLQSRSDEKRPWEIGVLYNEYETASKLAITYLETRNLVVGDQLPYSGKHLNATMNRHAEGNAIPYIGIEIRQDMVSSHAGQERFAQILTDMCHFVSEKLGLRSQNP